MSAVSFFKTQELHPSNQPQQKNSKTVEFPQTYVAPPRCLVGLKALDMRCGTLIRVAARADSIDSRNYTAHIDTWDDTTLYSGGINTLILKPANIDIFSGEFSTEDDHPVNQPQLETSRRINFERPFVTPPIVVVWLRKFVTGSGTSTRVRTYASDVDVRGFTIHIDTWADTTLWTAAAFWVAYPEDKDHIYSGTANTMDVRSWQNPQAKTREYINFQGTRFWKTPTVFTALNWIDISAVNNLRLDTYVDNVTTRGFTWNANTWDESKVWAVGMSYIAFD